MKRTMVFLTLFLLVSPLMSMAADGIWTKKADMPTRKCCAAAVALNGKIYVVGGLSPAWAPLATVEMYNPVTEQWTQKADMPTPRLRLALYTLNGKIYALGGTQNTFGNDVLATVEEYDPRTDRWQKKTDMPTARHSLSASVVDSKIYAVGGGKGPVSPPGTAVGFQTVEMYDPATDTWVKKADMPTPRYEHDAGVIDGKIYVAGGARANNNKLRTVEEYDPATDTWTKKADMQIARFTHTVSVVDNTLYAIGGRVGGVVEMYELTTDNWTRTASMPTARTDVSTAVVDGRIYVCGGWIGNVNGDAAAGIVSTVEEFDTGFREPQSVNPAGKLPTVWGRLKATK